jgi:chemotaxis protein histidine kinase CheA/ActR/RegA family two-component response regulator
MAELDADELRDLRAFFLDEAAEHVEALTASVRRLREEPTDRVAMAEVLRKLHTLKGSAGSVMLDEISARTHALEDRVVALSGRVEAPTVAEIDALADEVGDVTRMIAEVEREVRGGGARVVEVQRDSGSTPLVLSAPIPMEASGAGAAGAFHHETIRVEVQRVDELMDAASELVFDRTRVARRVQELDGAVRDLGKTRNALQALLPALEDAHVPPALTARLTELVGEVSDALAALTAATQGLGDDADGIARTSATLQERVRRVRMMAVGRLFQRLEAPLRDLARKEGKQLEVVTRGEETEIDKAVVERIAEPLLHLVRNAVAHGIEPPEERRAQGKPAAGRLTLAARHAGDAIELVVEDDGRGVDRERVRRALTAQGRAAPDAAAQLADAQLLDALFLPGLSTRTRPDDVAGRGVGLDAVRFAIERLGGTVRVRSTERRGTAFTVRLPLTTAVQQALLFKVGGQVYAVPAARVEEATTIAQSDVTTTDDGVDRVRLPAAPGREALDLPLVRLGALLGVPPPPGASHRRAALVIALGPDHPSGLTRYALTCDKVIGPREIVVRSLGPLLADLPLFAGATISGAGKVQLILDVDALAESGRRGVRVARPRRMGGARRVLVCDDSRSIREAASLFLQQGGYAVETVPDGWDAWELLQDRPFDLLVTDLEMPRLDGHELIARVRGSPELKGLPILVVSSRTADTMRTRVTSAGADAFVGKPLRKKPLLDAAEALLAARPAPSP